MTFRSAFALLLLLACRREVEPTASRPPAPPVVVESTAPPEKVVASESAHVPVGVPLVSNPPNASLSIDSVDAQNPLVVRGRARTFENSVFLRVRHGEEVLAETHTTAVGEMGQFNPWSASIWLTRLPTDGRVTVEAIEHSAKDGSVRNRVSRDAKLEFGSTELTLFFPLDDCTRFRSFERTVPKTVSVARVAAEALVNGPSPQEKAAGAGTPFPRGSAVRSVILRDGVLTVDLGQRLRNVGGSCAVTAIRESLTRTMKAIPGVRRVVITADGIEELALQP